MFPALLIEVILLFFVMSGLQLLIQYLMSRSSREHLLAGALSGGSLLALFAFHIPAVHAFLPAWELGDCLSSLGVGLALCIAATLGGALLAQWEPSQQPLDLDVWRRLEELAAVEQLEAARRLKQYNRFGRR